VSRYRFAIVAVVLVVFIGVGAYLIFGNKSSGPQNVTINVTVTDGTSMKPSELTAHHNHTETIHITINMDGELHLHGYDIAIDTRAGQVVSQTFKPVNTGDFPIEWESTSTDLGHLVVNP
jgi:hypothetical protein